MPLLPEPPGTPEAFTGRALVPLYAVTFIGTLGFGIVLTFLIFLVEEWGGNALVYGLLASTYPAFQLLGAPILGRWSDMYGRRKILFLSQVGTLVAWGIFLVAFFLPLIPVATIDSALLGIFVLTLPLLVLFVARALDGITGGNVSVANAYLADVTGDAERNQNFGRMSVASNMGYIVGPALAGILGATIYGEILPVIAAFLISVVGTLIIAFWLPESNRCAIAEKPDTGSVRKVFGQEHRDCSFAGGKGKLSFRGAFRISHIPFLLALYFLIFLGFNIYYTAFPAFAAGSLAWTAAELGIYYSAISVMMVVVQGPVLSRISKHYVEAVLIIAGSVILGIGFTVLVTGNMLFIYASAVLFAAGNGIMWPSFLSLLSKIAGKTYQGSVQGFAGSAGSLASIVGLILGGVLYEAIGPAAFLISGGIILVVFLLALRTLRFQPTTPRQPPEVTAPGMPSGPAETEDGMYPG
ncbi:MFS transporter [Methanoculleus taiwanensis]|uniref:MFS transporter n=1 Tax=Methanoculleus taiwanensis TaxID=1550565 RepID=UPI000FFEDD22|nr:MFS transporter [Methanoculleus taiwanensis]